jgi:hypothetical protein
LLTPAPATMTISGLIFLAPSFFGGGAGFEPATSRNHDACGVCVAQARPRPGV